MNFAMNPVVRDDYPSPISVRYHALHQAIRAVKPNYLKALGYLLDVVDIYLQFACYITVLSFLRSGKQPGPSLSRALKALQDEALSTGHWLEIWKQATAPFREDRAGLFVPGIYSVLYDERGDQAGWIRDIDKWPARRNAIRGHSFTFDESNAKTLIEDAIAPLERTLQVSEFLRETALIRVTECVPSAAESLYQSCWLKGLHPEDEPVLFSSPLQFDTNLIYVVQSNALKMASVSLEEQRLTLEPFVIVARAMPSEVAFFQGCKKNRALYLDTGLAAEERWDDTARKEILNSLLGTKTASAATASPRMVPEWAQNLRSCELVDPAQYVGWKSNPIAFYKGNQVSWADLANDLDIRRVLYHGQASYTYAEFFDSWVIPLLEQAAQSGDIPFLLFGGHGGSGKSTVLLRTAFEIATRFDDTAVLRLTLGAHPDLNELTRIRRESGAKSIFLVIDDVQRCAGQLESIFREARIRSIPLGCLAAERINQWDCPAVHPVVFELRSLTDEEIVALLDQLDRTDCLGTLKGKAPPERLAILRTFAEKQILVGLREATEGKGFDAIIEDEYIRIPDESARTVYRFSCLLESFGEHLPYDTAMRYAGCRTHSDVRRLLLRCQGVLVKRKAEHLGHVLTPRHRVIAEIVVQRVYRTVTGEFDHDALVEDVVDLLECLLVEVDGPLSKAVLRLVRSFLSHWDLATHVENSTCHDRFVRALCRFERRSHPGAIGLRTDSRGTLFQGTGFVLGIVRSWCGHGRRDAAILLLDKAVSGNTKRSWTLPWSLTLAELLAGPGKFNNIDRSIRICESALTNPEAATLKTAIVIRLSHLLQKRAGRGDLDLAIRLIQKARSSPDAGDLLGELTAREATLLEVRGSDGDVSRAIGILRHHVGRAEDARCLGEIVIQLAGLLEMRAGQGDFESGIDLLKEALQNPLLSEWENELKITLSRLRLKSGRPEDMDSAIELLNTVITSTHDAQERLALVLRLVRLFLDRRRPEDIDRGIAIILSHTDLWSDGNAKALIARRLGELYEERGSAGDLERAIELLEEAWQEPESVDDRKSVLFRLLMLLEHRGEPEDVARGLELIEQARQGARRKTFLAQILMKWIYALKSRGNTQDINELTKILQFINCNIKTHKAIPYLMKCVDRMMTEISESTKSALADMPAQPVLHKESDIDESRLIGHILHGILADDSEEDSPSKT